MEIYTSELPKYVFLSKFKLLWGNIEHVFVLYVNFTNFKLISKAFIESNEINGALNENIQFKR